MEIIITEWALNSYLELKGEQVFTDEEYREYIRPDVMRLKEYPIDPKFSQEKFWSVAKGQNGQAIPHGFKMKWHQVGNGCIQLRLTVGILNAQCFLCEAYVKGNEKKEARKLARFKTFLQNIREGKYTVRGKLI